MTLATHVCVPLNCNVLYCVHQLLCYCFTEELNMTVLILVAIYFVGAIASMIRSWIFVLAGQRLVARLRKHLYAAIIKQEVAFFDTNR